MGISVKISGPMQTNEEVAKQLGISLKRQREIRQIVRKAALGFKDKTSRRAVTPKTSASRSKAA